MHTVTRVRSAVHACVVTLRSKPAPDSAAPAPRARITRTAPISATTPRPLPAGAGLVAPSGDGPQARV